ncbi:MAG: hypothetical protein V4795_18215, partial [Pseudomonadota bacterium]
KALLELSDTSAVLVSTEAGASPVRLEQSRPEAARHIPRPCHPTQGCDAQTSARHDRCMRWPCVMAIS